MAAVRSSAQRKRSYAAEDPSMLCHLPYRPAAAHLSVCLQAADGCQSIRAF